MVLFLTLSPPFLPSPPHLPTPFPVLIRTEVDELPVWYIIIRVLLLEDEFEGDKLLVLKRLLRNRGETMTWKGPVTGTDAKNHATLLEALGKFNDSHKRALEPLLLAANFAIARAAEVILEQEIISTGRDDDDSSSGLISTPLAFADPLIEIPILTFNDTRKWYRIDRKVWLASPEKKYVPRAQDPAWAAAAADTIERYADVYTLLQNLLVATDELKEATASHNEYVRSALKGSRFLQKGFTNWGDAFRDSMSQFSPRTLNADEAVQLSVMLGCPPLAQADVVLSDVPVGGRLGFSVYLRTSDGNVCAVTENGQAMPIPLVKSYVLSSYSLLWRSCRNLPPLLSSKSHLQGWGHLSLMLKQLPRYQSCAAVSKASLGALADQYINEPSMLKHGDIADLRGGRPPNCGVLLGYCADPIFSIGQCSEESCECGCHGVGSQDGCTSCTAPKLNQVEEHSVASRPGRTVAGIHVRAADCTFKMYSEASGEPLARQALRCPECSNIVKRCSKQTARQVGEVDTDEVEVEEVVENPAAAVETLLQSFDYNEAMAAVERGSSLEKSAMILRLITHSQALEKELEDMKILAHDLQVKLDNSILLHDIDSDKLREMLLSESFMKAVWDLPNEHLGLGSESDPALARNKKRLLILMCREAAGANIGGNKGNSWHPELVSLFQHLKAVSNPAFNLVKTFLPGPSGTTINRATSVVSSKGGVDLQKSQQTRVALTLNGLNPTKGLVVQLSMDVLHVRKNFYVDSSGFVVGTIADVGKFVLFPSAPRPKKAAKTDVDTTTTATGTATPAATVTVTAAAAATATDADNLEDEEEESEEETDVGAGAGAGSKRAAKTKKVGARPKKAKADLPGGVVDTAAGMLLVVKWRAIGHARLTGEVASYPISSESAEVVLEAYRECCDLCVDAGMIVKAVCFDAGTGNRKAASLLTRVFCDPTDLDAKASLDAGKAPHYFVCPVQKTRVYIIYDADHLLKRLVMAVFNSGARTSKAGAKKTTHRAMLYDPLGVPVSFAHVLLTQKVDVSANGTMSATFVTARALLKRGADKMSVPHALMVACNSTVSFMLQIGRPQWDKYIDENLNGRPLLPPCPYPRKALTPSTSAAATTAAAAPPTVLGGASIGQTQGVPEAMRNNTHSGSARILHLACNIFRALYSGTFLTAADADSDRLVRAEAAAQYLVDWSSEGPRNKGFLHSAVADDSLSSVRALRALLREVGERSVVQPDGSSTLVGIKIWGRALSTTDLEHHFGAVRGARGYHTTMGDNPTVADALRMGAVLYGEDVRKFTRKTDYQATVAGRNVMGTDTPLLLSVDLGISDKAAAVELDKIRSALLLAAEKKEEEDTSPSIAFRASLIEGTIFYYTATNEPGAGNEAKLTAVLSMERIEPLPSSFTGRYFQRAGMSADPARSMVPAVHPDATNIRIKVRSNSLLLRRVRDAMSIPKNLPKDSLTTRLVPPLFSPYFGDERVNPDPFPADFALDISPAATGSAPIYFEGNYLGTLIVKAIHSVTTPLLTKKKFLELRGGFADALHRAIINDGEVSRLITVASQLNPLKEVDCWQLYEIKWIIGWWYVLVAMKRFRLRALDAVLEEAKARDPTQAGNFRKMVSCLDLVVGSSSSKAGT
jgi:hypothetical protein